MGSEIKSNFYADRSASDRGWCEPVDQLASLAAFVFFEHRPGHTPAARGVLADGRYPGSGRKKQRTKNRNQRDIRRQIHRQVPIGRERQIRPASREINREKDIDESRRA